jgi:hypothetical protein
MFTVLGLWKLFPFIMLGVLYLFQLMLKGIGWVATQMGWISYLDNLDTKIVLLFFMLMVTSVFIFLAQIIFTAETVMSTLLYRHIHKQPTGFLSPETIDAALQEVK